MAAKVGELIKEARKSAGFTQEKLAKKVGGKLSAADISMAERGELELSTAVLRKIAVATGVTQSSLVNAARDTTSAKKTSTVKKTSTPTNAGISMRVTSTEKKLIEYYRNADSKTKKAATSLLKGEQSDLLSMLSETLTPSSSSKTDSPISDLLGNALESLLGGK